MQIYNLTTSSYSLLLKYLLYITTLAITPYLLPKCLSIVYFVLLTSSIALLLTLYWTAKKLYIKPINPIGLILFNPFLFTTLLILYIEEKKETVLIITFNRPSAAYKPNCSRYCFCYYFRHYFSPYTTCINLAATPHINLATTTCINPAATTHINLAVTTCINLAITYYSPPYCKATKLWSYYHLPYYGAARSQSYKYCLQLLRHPILD